MATDSARLKLEKVYHWFDTFHNTEPERHPGKTGCCLTLLMVPAVLIYGIVWFVQHQQKPPVETLVIDWSISYGPYPMKVSCHEGASCWLYLSGCESESSGRCISLAAGQELELQMCYSLAAREGLHAWWTGSSSGISIYSQAKSMWMKQAIEAGRSSMTYVKTEDKTKESGEWERLRHEWFTMYLSSEALAPEHSGCQEHRSGAYAAQIVMKPEFYEKTLEKLDFIVSLIGEVGGAYGIISTIFFALYILLWNVENANQKSHDQSLPVTAPAPVAMEPGAEITTTPKAEVTPPPPTRSATDDMMVEHTREAFV
ncbi:unnamed protein product [Cladocopium goreaui]|uniref:Uncharacterized protein n=1 Tax=Cladocopium goreaui TaxID=2562237 RepID=A0A9P1BP56_9DINO|nr:unnamed protein product [Cladocopium goreaui]